MSFISFAVLNNQGLITSILSKVEDLTSQVEVMNSSIRQVDDLLHQGTKIFNQDSGNEASHDKVNLEECIHSAKKLVSAASGVVNALTETSSAMIEGGYVDSEIGLLFTDQQRLVVQNWLFEPTIYETENDHDAELGSPSVTSTSQTEPIVDTSIFTSTSGVETADTHHTQPLEETAAEESDSDLEAEIIGHWQRKGGQKLSEGQYSEAASYLEKALKQAESKHDGKVHFEGRNGTLELLAIAYYHQDKLNDSEEILGKFSEPYEGKLKVLDMLVSVHCERSQWEQAEELVLKHTDSQTRDRRLEELAVRSFKESQWNIARNILFKHPNFEGRDKTLKLVASACYQKDELEMAKDLLLEYLKGKTEQDVQCLESLQMLTDLYLRIGELELAVTFGKRALKCTRKAVGRRHKLFFESVLSIVEMYITKGDIIEADGYAALVSSSEEYLSKLQGELLRESSYSRPRRPWSFVLYGTPYSGREYRHRHF